MHTETLPVHVRVQDGPQVQALIVQRLQVGVPMEVVMLAMALERLCQRKGTHAAHMG